MSEQAKRLYEAVYASSYATLHSSGLSPGVCVIGAARIAEQAVEASQKRLERIAEYAQPDATDWMFVEVFGE